jgi:hypothetical protein
MRGLRILTASSTRLFSSIHDLFVIVCSLACIIVIMMSNDLAQPPAARIGLDVLLRLSRWKEATI